MKIKEAIRGIMTMRRVKNRHIRNEAGIENITRVLSNENMTLKTLLKLTKSLKFRLELVPEELDKSVFSRELTLEGDEFYNGPLYLIPARDVPVRFMMIEGSKWICIEDLGDYCGCYAISLVNAINALAGRALAAIAIEYGPGPDPDWVYFARLEHCKLIPSTMVLKPDKLRILYDESRLEEWKEPLFVEDNPRADIDTFKRDELVWPVNNEVRCADLYAWYSVWCYKTGHKNYGWEIFKDYISRSFSRINRDKFYGVIHKSKYDEYEQAHEDEF
jgi:hypothetical protein